MKKSKAVILTKEELAKLICPDERLEYFQAVRFLDERAFIDKDFNIRYNAFASKWFKDERGLTDEDWYIRFLSFKAIDFKDVRAFTDSHDSTREFSKKALTSFLDGEGLAELAKTVGFC